MPRYEQPFTFSSTDGIGKIKSVNLDEGDSYLVPLYEPIHIPKEAYNCHMGVHSVSLWWNVYNILENQNDLIKITYDDGINPLVTITLTIRPGLYSVEHLNSEINREIVNDGSLPVDFMNVIPDTASQRTVINFKYSGSQINFSINQTFRVILGFDSRLVPIAPTSGEGFVYSDNRAVFNQINEILVHSDIITNGLLTNGYYSYTICRVPLDVKPSSQINKYYTNILKFPAKELVGNKKTVVKFWLTDENNGYISTNEPWSVTVVIFYDLD